MDVNSHLYGWSMTAYRCDVTSVLAAQMPCQPTNFCLLLLSAVPYFTYFEFTLLSNSAVRIKNRIWLLYCYGGFQIE